MQTKSNEIKQINTNIEPICKVLQSYVNYYKGNKSLVNGYKGGVYFCDVGKGGK